MKLKFDKLDQSSSSSDENDEETEVATSNAADARQPKDIADERISSSSFFENSLRPSKRDTPNDTNGKLDNHSKSFEDEAASRSPVTGANGASQAAESDKSDSPAYNGNFLLSYPQKYC